MDSTKNMENERQEVNILGLKVADHVNAMLAYWDKNLVCRFANSAYVDWFGKSKEEMVDKITIKDLLGPLYGQNLPYIIAALKGKTQTFEREIPLPSGGIRHSLANYYPDIVDGEVLGFFAHVADVTPLKLLEKELKASNERINDQNRRLLNFSNIVSHNLKSYSTNLTSILKVINDADTEEEKNKAFGYLERISEGFSLTVEHLNEVSKSHNLAKLNPVRINLNDYIEKTKETLLVEIESTNAIIKNSVNKEIEILANPAYMDSILLNLLTNAIKYRHPKRSPIIEFTSFIKDGKTIFEIKDNGIGINLEKHGSDLFNMYKTFHGNSDAKGVGLFITKYQVETMGGKIEVDSNENVGTTFTISFNPIKGLN